MVSSTAILLVSFGCAYEEKRKKTLDAIEQQVREAFPQSLVLHAWSSSILRRRRMAGEGVLVPSVEEALAQLGKADWEQLLIQPTYLLPGFEYARMCEAAFAFAQAGQRRVFVSTPLLQRKEDALFVLQELSIRYPKKEDEAFVLLGHGTAHESNVLYQQMQEMLLELGREDMRIGCIEAEPGFAAVLQALSAGRFKRVTLLPLLLVAGGHALVDLAGEKSDSWKSRLERAGYPVEVILHGLGELPAVQELVLRQMRLCNKGESNGH